MNNILTIMKKELARFFGDKRILFSTVLLPGLIIFIMYSFMGDAMGNMIQGDPDQAANISAVNLPSSVKALTGQANLKLTEIDSSQTEEVKKAITEKTADLCIIFPENFDTAVAEYDSASGQTAPNIEIYYNSAEGKSQSAYSQFVALLDSYESLMSNKFDINHAGESSQYDLAKKEDVTGMIFSSMMPLLLMIFLFSGCMAVAPESISGEKERGTIATLLITPIKRSQIAIGKILALAVVALLSGTSSTLGTLLSLPKLMGGVEELDANVYGVNDYALLGVVILSTVLLLITLISIISAYAKTIKEAQTLVMPLMVIVMLVAVTGMFGGGAKAEMYFYLIPLYNSVQCMTGIFSFSMEPINALIAVASNLVYTGIGVYVLAKMFNSERIVFNK